MSRFCSDFSVSIFVLSRPRAAVKRDPPSPSRNSRHWSDAGCHRFTGRVTTSNPVTPRDLFLLPLPSFLLSFSSSLVLFFGIRAPFFAFHRFHGSQLRSTLSLSWFRRNCFQSIKGKIFSCRLIFACKSLHATLILHSILS